MVRDVSLIGQAYASGVVRGGESRGMIALKQNLSVLARRKGERMLLEKRIIAPQSPPFAGLTFTHIPIHKQNDTLPSPPLPHM